MQTTAIGEVIPQRMAGEGVLTYARRLKKEGFIPSEVMDASLYGIAQRQQHEEHKAHTDELKASHACLACEGVGSVKDAQGDLIQCLQCQGSGMETAQESDLAPKEIEFLEYLRSKDVFKPKLTAENIHRIFGYCQYKKISENDCEQMAEQFFKRVRVAKHKDCYGKDIYFVVCDARPAWQYTERIEWEKTNRRQSAAEEAVPF